MSIEKSYSVTLKLAMTEWGTFESIRLLKGRSTLDEGVLKNINTALQNTLSPAPPIRTTVAIGDAAEVKVTNHLMKLSSNNIDFQVFDTSSQTGHGDISIVHQSKRICIEVKCYTKPVPMKEIDKYYHSLALPEYDAGIIIQLDPCGYAAAARLRSPIDFNVRNGKPSAYLTAVDLELLYPVINLLILTCSNKSKLNIDLPDENGALTDFEQMRIQVELEKKRQALVSIQEKIATVRNYIVDQKAIITHLQNTVEDIVKLSFE